MSAAPSFSAPITSPAPIATAAEAEKLIAHFLEVMDKLVDVLRQETDLVRGRLAAGGLTGVTAGVTGNALSFAVASSATANSLTLTGSTGVTTALGVTNATSNGVASVSTPDATRTSLQTDYNNVLTQIDCAVDGYLLQRHQPAQRRQPQGGPSTKTAPRPLTIKGVTYNTSTWASPADRHDVPSQHQHRLDHRPDRHCLGQPADPGIRFGSTLTTVQTRQDFTKTMITTLQTGADNLVLADTNEEGANVLALQTRQSLSTTALSIANQANQAVLRLFG